DAGEGLGGERLAGGGEGGLEPGARGRVPGPAEGGGAAGAGLRRARPGERQRHRPADGRGAAAEREEAPGGVAPQVGEDRVHRRVAARRIDAEPAAQEGGEEARRAAREARAALDLGGALVDRGTRERQLAVERLVQRDAEAELVGALGGAVA